MLISMLHLYNDNSDYSVQIAAINYVIMHVVFECEIASVAMAGDGRRWPALFVRTLFWQRKEAKSMPQRR